MRYDAHLSYSAHRWIGVHAPWIPDVTREFVDALKATFPARAWDANTKTWWVPGGPENRKRVEQLFLNYFGERVVLGDEPGAAPKRGANGCGAYFDLGLDPGAPDSVVKAAYKALAFELHPDRHGGSAEPFHRVNNAYDQIRRERGLR